MLLDKLMEPRGELRGGGSKVSWERAMGAGLLFLYTLLADKVSKLAFVCWTVSARLQIILELSSKPEVTAKSPSLTISSCSLHFICFPYLCPLLASLFFFFTSILIMNIYLCSLTLGFFLVSLLWSKTCFLF